MKHVVNNDIVFKCSMISRLGFLYWMMKRKELLEAVKLLVGWVSDVESAVVDIEMSVSAMEHELPNLVVQVLVEWVVVLKGKVLVDGLI